MHFPFIEESVKIKLQQLMNSASNYHDFMVQLCDEVCSTDLDDTMISLAFVQRAFKSAGFKEVGIRRKAYFTMGEFRDIIIMDILKEEFFEKYPPGITIEDSIQ